MPYIAYVIGYHMYFDSEQDAMKYATDYVTEFSAKTIMVSKLIAEVKVVDETLKIAYPDK